MEQTDQDLVERGLRKMLNNGIDTGAVLRNNGINVEE